MNIKDGPINTMNNNISDIDLNGLKNSAKKSINSELDSLKAQLNNLKSFVDEKSFKRNTKELFKEEFSIRFKTILEDFDILQSNLKTSNVLDEVQNEVFEEAFNYLAPPDEIVEENIIEI